jgi:hypothetical protein
MAQFKSKHAVLLHYSVSMQCMHVMQCNTRNAMQCNAMQYNAMQCNTMQCNAMQCMYGSPSVRTEWSQSVIFFFFFHFFKNTKWQNLVEARFRTQDPLKWKSECTDGRTYGMKSFYLSLKWKYQCKMSVCTNVTDGQTSFSYFSLVSVQSCQ